MNVNFILTKDFFRGGGVETYTREVGRRLAARGDQVTVYTTKGEEGGPQFWEGVRLVWLPKVKPFWVEKMSGAIAATWRALRDEKPDIFHLHSVAAGAMAPLLQIRGVP